MKTNTATKTAVTWIILGGVAALAASMALGLPWGDKSTVGTVDTLAPSNCWYQQEIPSSRNCAGIKPGPDSVCQTVDGYSGSCVADGRGVCTCVPTTTKTGGKNTYKPYRIKCVDKESGSVYWDDVTPDPKDTEQEIYQYLVKTAASECKGNGKIYTLYKPDGSVFTGTR